MALSSTATTIVSGAMAERTNLRSYMLYSFVSTLTTCFPSHWIWGKYGFLKELGVVDIAGCSGIHLVGGSAGLAACLILGPRQGRFDQGRKKPPPCSLTNVLLGMFMLWWGWLGFNCGSTFGLSGEKWKLASRTAVVTLNSSVGGGILGIIYSYVRNSEHLSVPIFVTGIRGGLVGATGICAICRPWEGLLIGFIGGLFACLLSDFMEKLKIDDPVNCIATHAGSGMVTVKNETNIMVKNAIDIIFSGFSFWLVGFGLSFGVDDGTNAFSGVGYFMTEVPVAEGRIYAMFFFQMALASTATTIVSGAMAERTNLRAYMLYSFVSTLTTCFPTHWIWGKYGFLREMGVVDIAGCSGVHLVGGAAGLSAALILGPRHGRYDRGRKRPQPCSMTNVLLGVFMLWWGWLGFNCGSTFGLSGDKWKLAARSAVVTLNGSIGGGILGIVYSYIRDRETLSVPIFVTGVRGGLVGVTGICAVCRPWEGIIIGFIGGLFACLLSDLMERLKIDDPVNCVATHAGSGIWGMIAVAFFVEQDNLEGFTSANGIFKGGSWRLLGVQLCAVFVTGGWAVVTTLLQLYVIEKTIGIRLNLEEELQGCDFVEHGIGTDITTPIRNSSTNKDLEDQFEERKTASTVSVQSVRSAQEYQEINPPKTHSPINGSQDIEALILAEIENMNPKAQISNVLQNRKTADKGVQAKLP